ncbi:alcohol dehydrogenase catalytic domain-containing protein [Streptomyces avicenniae]|uniref:alcohol dehydrogenase catalytic domain-containing protein n=1 Tax=Streptomyces avicenniae TaxID=500153 RepID=UPI00069B8E2D|nr:alcohol dehydrogenase catalytic domain-containing protein [Streptomyces avicenniae]
MARHRAAQIPAPGEDFTLAEVETTEPGPLDVRIAVEACGVCGSDGAIIAGQQPGVTFPLTPGHEIAGRIDALGELVTGWDVGDRVAVGWYGGSCGHCDACRSGDGILCPEVRIPSVAYPGGYAESVTVPAVALAAIPEGMPAAEAAPLACAGVTAYNALRRSNARPDDTVAVLGLGGIGHLGVQFAAAMGFETIAVARGEEKGALARELGAHHYIDSTQEDIAEGLQRLGGARVILATVNHAAVMAAAVPGLGRRGQLIALGIAPEPLEIPALALLENNRTIHAHASGIALDTQDTLRFAHRHGVHPWIETRPLAEAGAALAKMTEGKARFRMVLTPA